MVDPMADTLETHNGLGWPKRNLQSHMSHVFGWTNGWTIENSRWAWLAHWKLLHCLCHCPSIQLCRNRHCVLVFLQKCTFLKSWILNSMRPALWCFRSWLRIENAPSLLRSAFAYNLECPALRITSGDNKSNYWKLKLLVITLSSKLKLSSLSSFLPESWNLMIWYFGVVYILMFDIFVLFPPWKMELDVQQ